MFPLTRMRLIPRTATPVGLPARRAIRAVLEAEPGDVPVWLAGDAAEALLRADADLRAAGMAPAVAAVDERIGLADLSPASADRFRLGGWELWRAVMATHAPTVLAARPGRLDQGAGWSAVRLTTPSNPVRRGIALVGAAQGLSDAFALTAADAVALVRAWGVGRALRWNDSDTAVLARSAPHLRLSCVPCDASEESADDPGVTVAAARTAAARAAA